MRAEYLLGLHTRGGGQGGSRVRWRVALGLPRGSESQPGPPGPWALLAHTMELWWPNGWACAVPRRGQPSAAPSSSPRKEQTAGRFC